MCVKCVLNGFYNDKLIPLGISMKMFFTNIYCLGRNVTFDIDVAVTVYTIFSRRSRSSEPFISVSSSSNSLVYSCPSAAALNLNLSTLTFIPCSSSP